MVNSTEFGKRLQEILQYYGLSATAFSEAIDFNRSTISHLLSGRNRPSLEFVMKVLQQFPEVELYWLLNGTGAFPVVKNEPSLPSPDAIESSVNKKSLDEGKKTIKTIADISQNTNDSDDLDQIILFFKDGSFKVYKNHRK
jgi:transcriptional regulator with XRE-family HTH domain